ncbi:CapA family protein [Amycolatopsis acidiphila]|uniref:CapA family protein n=1 Tax=Amycolatopsis acidiphila TaxID=715473 RepID=A0A558AHR8_9PSEU|nr:CapA family protein [Amycolatopsis acidiphila]
MDGGFAALLRTRELLEEQGAAVAGAGENQAAARRPVIRRTPHGTVAVLAYSAVFPQVTRRVPAGPASPRCARTASTRRGRRTSGIPGCCRA